MMIEMNEMHKETPRDDFIIQRKYKVLKEIGKGSFSNVFKGISLKTGDFVAIKIERVYREEEEGAKEQGDAIRILKRETTLLNYLGKDCRNVPKIYWFGNVGNAACLILPFYEYSLYDWSKMTSLEYKLMKVEGIRKRMIQILREIHGKGVIHRDIKPHNFMVKNNELYIIDFGLAAFYIDKDGNHVPDTMSGKGSIVGTPNYISLFVHWGHTPSRRDDLISVEYICLQLRGEMPWPDNSPLDEIIRHKTELLLESPSLKEVYGIEYSQKPKY